MAMNRQTRQSVLLSVLVHVAGVLVFVVLVWAESWLERPEPVVLELVSAEPAAAVEEAPEQEEEAELESFDVDRPEPLAEVPPVPEEAEVEPEAEAQPEAEAAPERMSFEEWARERDLPERVQRVERRRQAVEAPRIETDLRERLESELPAIEVAGIDLDQMVDDGELRRYLGKLQSAIQAAFRGTGEGLEAEVAFTVSAAGRIGDVRIVKASGDAVFDRRAVEAVREARSVGAPPGGRSYPFRQSFRGE